MDILINLFKEMSVFLVLAYLFSKTPVFKNLVSNRLSVKEKVFIYFIFSAMSIIGTYFGIPIRDAIANNRAMGAVLAGLIGGPAMGAAVGATAGLHRFLLGGFTAFSCGLSTITEGILGGLVHYYFVSFGKSERIFDPKIAFGITFLAEVIQMTIILVTAEPFNAAWELVQVIAFPMIFANAIGNTLVVSIFRDQKYAIEKIGTYYAERALKIARRSLKILYKGYNEETAKRLAEIIIEETGVASVAITDTAKVIAFEGLGKENFRQNMEISSDYTKKAIKNNEVIFINRWSDNSEIHKYNPDLSSNLIVPVRLSGEVIGTIKFYEQKNKAFSSINKALGEGIADLIAVQLLAAKYEEQKNLLLKSELKLVQAQINPHFLFNTINTIIAVTRTKPEEGIKLLQNLSGFFRKNLKRSGDFSSLREELEHVNSYLEIEKARFKENLIIDMDIDESLLGVRLPTFTLQPLVENAIKHGISRIMEKGVVSIIVKRDAEDAIIIIEDNGGALEEKENSDGLGTSIVDKRIKNYAGEKYGMQLSGIIDEKTTATVRIPIEGILT